MDSSYTDTDITHNNIVKRTLDSIYTRYLHEAAGANDDRVVGVDVGAGVVRGAAARGVGVAVGQLGRGGAVAEAGAVAAVVVAVHGPAVAARLRTRDLLVVVRGRGPASENTHTEYISRSGA